MYILRKWFSEKLNISRKFSSNAFDKITTVCKERLPLYSSWNVLLLGRHAPFNLHDYLVSVDTLKSISTRGTVLIMIKSRGRWRRWRRGTTYVSVRFYLYPCLLRPTIPLFISPLSLFPFLFHSPTPPQLSPDHPLPPSASFLSLLSLSLSTLGSLIHPCGPYERGELSHPSTQSTFYPSPLFRRVEPRARLSYWGSGDYTSYTSSSIQSAPACQLADIVAAARHRVSRRTGAISRDYRVLPGPKGERALINGDS